MPVRAFHCENCGAPLPTDGRKRSVRCRYCNALLRLDQDEVKAARYRDALVQVDDELAGVGERPLVRHAGRRYRILGRIGRGASCDVFLADWCRRVTERVLLKVPRWRDDDDLLEREWRILDELARSDAAGTARLGRRVPHPVAFGPLDEGPGPGRPALAVRYRPGYAHTLVEVRGAHPAGLDPRHAVWLWRRLAEVLGFAHESGLVHGAVLPEHVVVQARDHGVMLVGWSCAVRTGEKLPALSEPHLSFYPAMARQAGRIGPAGDLVMAARTIAWTLGAAPEDPLPPSLPRPLRALLDEWRQEERASTALNGLAMAQEIAAAGHAAYGAPRYVKLTLPGWR